MCRRFRHTPRLRALSEEEPESAPELIVDVGIAHAIEELPPLETQLQLILIGRSDDRDVCVAQPAKRDRVRIRVIEVPEREAGAELQATRANEAVSDFAIGKRAAAIAFVGVEREANR